MVMHRYTAVFMFKKPRVLVLKGKYGREEKKANETKNRRRKKNIEYFH